MKLIKPSHKIWEQAPGIDGVYKAIEKAGRICYHSEDKITEDSAKGFVGRMVANKHLAMCEHGTVYLYIRGTDKTDLNKYLFNKYSKVVEGSLDNFYITTNYRVLIENNWLDDLKYLCEPTEFHEKRISVHFTADIGVIREFFRHRVFSMAQESTRYCDYSKDKFNNELTFILPPWLDIKEGYWQCGHEYIGGWFYWFKDDYDSKVFPKTNEEHNIFDFIETLSISENTYLNLINNGWKPQQARVVLPLSLKSEAIMTGFVSDWQHFFNLRTSIIAITGQPHPQASELADPLYKEFIRRGYINE